jgi:hypothetical protein
MMGAFVELVSVVLVAVVVITIVSLSFARHRLSLGEDERCPALVRYNQGSDRRCVYPIGHAGPHHVPEDSRVYETWWPNTEGSEKEIFGLESEKKVP